MTTSDKQLAAMDRWNEYAPMVPSLELADRADFFATAPDGTVVEVYDELYRRVPSGAWLHLEELVYAGNAYSEYREHDSSSPEHMASAVAGSEHTVVRVLRLGEGLGWN